ncbi:hypothetical protein ACDX78_02115 [Virgibacillus oceani]
MQFEVRSINTRYKESQIDNVQVSYKANTESRSVNGNGNFNLSADEYEGNESIATLEQMAKQHLLDEVPNLNFEVRSINTRYSDDEVVSVQISYTTRNDNRTVSFNGNFELSDKEYEENKAMERLEEMAEEIFIEEVNAE